MYLSGVFTPIKNYSIEAKTIFENEVCISVTEIEKGERLFINFSSDKQLELAVMPLHELVILLNGLEPAVIYKETELCIDIQLNDLDGFFAIVLCNWSAEPVTFNGSFKCQ